MPVPKQPAVLVRENTRDKILNQLYAWLIDGTLKPGERLHDEELSAYFNVSRTPVREALQVLNQKQLVEVLPSRMTRVAPITIEEAERTFPLYAELQSIAVKFAYPHITNMSVQSLERLNTQLKEAFASHASFSEIQRIDKDFHQTIIELADNKYLSNMIDELEIHIYRAENHFFAYKERSMNSVIDHQRIIDALKEHDLETAVQITYQNWMLNYKGLLKAVEQ